MFSDADLSAGLELRDDGCIIEYQDIKSQILSGSDISGCVLLVVSLVIAHARLFGLGPWAMDDLIHGNKILASMLHAFE